VNYMKEGTSHDMFVDDKNNLVIKSRNLPLKEYMDIMLNQVHFMEARER